MSQLFHKENKMAYVININYQLLSIIHRFGIPLGFKDKTIEEVCQEYKINPDFFTIIINTYQNENYFPEEKLLSFSPLLIIDYLKKTHNDYKEYELKKLDYYLHELVKSCQHNCTNILSIENFYLKYKNELLMHIEEEETKVFPYVQLLLKNPESLNPDFSIRYIEKEHDSVDVQLNDLKNLIIKYLQPHYDPYLCNEFLFALFRFENDMKKHARIEENILIPQIIELEKVVVNQLNRK